jgi:hypothetical protein
MHFQIIPVAEASVLTLIKSIDRVLINPIIFFLFACALAYFLFGVVQYFVSADNEEVRKKSKSHMIWGVIGLFIMVAVFGIMRLILSTVGENKIKINNNGDFVVDGSNLTNTTNNSPKGGTDIFKSDPVDIGIDPVSINVPVEQQFPSVAYTTNPLTKIYVEVPLLCWHEIFYVSNKTEYLGLQEIEKDARDRYLKANNLGPTEHVNYPIVYDSKTLYEEASKLYHIWRDVRAPIGTGTIKDCALVEVLPPEALPLPTDQSKKPDPLTYSYISNNKYYRAVDSGVGPDLFTARGKAINNALLQIAAMKGLTNVSTLRFGITILEEQYYIQDPPETGDYDYWVALQMKK